MKSNSQYRPVLEEALKHSLTYLDQLDQMPVGATASLPELRERLRHALTEDGIDPLQVINDLAADTRGGILGSAGGRFFAWVIGGSVPAALAADWLTSAWDQNAGLYACAPAEAVIEEVAGAWLKDLLGLPSGASFAFVTGTQMAHVTCLAAARHTLLARRNWDVEKKGLQGAPPIRVLTSSERHGTNDRAIRLLGMGSESVATLPAANDGRLNVDSLRSALQREPEIATIVVLSAGDLNIGAFDSFEELIPIAHAHKAWVHVDGAFGLWANASERLRHLLKGVEQADSWVTDGHKWLNVPYDSGYAFVADQEGHRASMSHRASYLVHDEDARDELDWNPEWSRRGRGVATYAAIRQLGRRGIADMIDRACLHAHALVTEIGGLPGAEVVWTPQINQGLVRFIDPSPEATNADHDRRTDAVIDAINKTGEAFFGGTTWRGKRCMRVSVSCWQTDEGDVERTVRAVKRVLAR